MEDQSVDGDVVSNDDVGLPRSLHVINMKKGNDK